MGLFKPDFYRFLALGFAAGAVLVFLTLGGGANGPAAHDIVPRAVAAPAR